MNSKEIIKAEEKYFINTFNRQPIVLDRGQGSIVYDKDGKKYIDFLAGIAVNSLGHSHPKVVEAIKKQSENLIHISNIYYNEQSVILAEKLTTISSLDKIFFCNSGTEANEGAIKLALKHTGKSEIIAMKNSFHGRTIAALTATGQDEYKKDYLKNLPHGFKHAEFGDIESIKKVITENTAAIIIEPIQGEGGINIASKEFYNELSKLCKEKEILLILDEIQTGFGRCGVMFAKELFNLDPDIMCIAKTMGGGIPIGGILAKEEIANTFSPGDHGTTFGGGPLVCAASNAVVDTIIEEKLVEKSYETGKYFKNKLMVLKEKHSKIKEVRGYGLMLGVEIDEPCGKYVDILREKGFLINCTAKNILRFLPPLIITTEEIDKLIDVLDEVIK